MKEKILINNTLKPTETIQELLRRLMIESK